MTETDGTDAHRPVGPAGSAGSSGIGAWIGLGAIFLLALGLRLLASAMLQGVGEGPNVRAFGADAAEFNALARHLVQRREYAVEPGRLTSFRAPGFPFALATVDWVFGADSFAAARGFFFVTGALLTVAVYPPGAGSHQ